MEDWIGYAAATFTTSCFIPQVWHALRTKDMHAVSLAMYAMFCTGVALWLLYGICVGKWPIIISNIITLGLALIVLILKIQHVRQQHSVDQTSRNTKSN